MQNHQSNGDFVKTQLLCILKVYVVKQGIADEKKKQSILYDIMTQYQVTKCCLMSIFGLTSECVLSNSSKRHHNTVLMGVLITGSSSCDLGSDFPSSVACLEVTVLKG